MGPPTLNQLRAINGAEPIPGGDVPWNPDGLTITAGEPLTMEVGP
jgi:hypothetical protein